MSQALACTSLHIVIEHDAFAITSFIRPGIVFRLQRISHHNPQIIVGFAQPASMLRPAAIPRPVAGNCSNPSVVTIDDDCASTRSTTRVGKSTTANVENVVL